MKTRSQTELSLSDNFHYAYYVLDFRRIVADKTKWIRYTWTYRDCGCHRCCNNCYYEINTNFIFMAFSLFPNCCCCWGCQCFCCHRRRRHRMFTVVHMGPLFIYWIRCSIVVDYMFVRCLGTFQFESTFSLLLEILKKVSLRLKRYGNWTKYVPRYSKIQFFTKIKSLSSKYVRRKKWQFSISIYWIWCIKNRSIWWIVQLIIYCMLNIRY